MFTHAGDEKSKLKIDIINENIKGDFAEVIAKYWFGSDFDEYTILLLNKNGWKIASIKSKKFNYEIDLR
jgi:hypothetical protein